MAHILSVSYDELLLRTRHLILEREGYDVVSSLGFDDSVEHCRRNDFDLFILGHSIRHSDKQQLVEPFRHECPAPIISLRRLDEPPVSDCRLLHRPRPARTAQSRGHSSSWRGWPTKMNRQRKAENRLFGLNLASHAVSSLHSRSRRSCCLGCRAGVLRGGCHHLNLYSEVAAADVLFMYAIRALLVPANECKLL